MRVEDGALFVDGEVALGTVELRFRRLDAADTLTRLERLRVGS